MCEDLAMSSWLNSQAGIYPILLSARFRRVNPVNPARGDISDISLLTRYSSFKPVKPPRALGLIDLRRKYLSLQFC